MSEEIQKPLEKYGRDITKAVIDGKVDLCKFGITDLLIL